MKSNLSNYNLVDVNNFTEKELMSRMITMIFEEKIGKEKSKKYKIINNKQTLIKVVLELLLSNFATKSSLQI